MLFFQLAELRQHYFQWGGLSLFPFTLLLMGTVLHFELTWTYLCTVWWSWQWWFENHHFHSTSPNHPGLIICVYNKICEWRAFLWSCLWSWTQVELSRSHRSRKFGASTLAAMPSLSLPTFTIIPPTPRICNYECAIVVIEGCEDDIVMRAHRYGELKRRLLLPSPTSLILKQLLSESLQNPCSSLHKLKWQINGQFHPQTVKGIM